MSKFPIFLAGLSLVSLTILVCLHRVPEFLRVGPTPERKLQVSSARMAGWDKGQKRWAARAQTLWTGQDPQIVYFEQLSEGVLWDTRKKMVFQHLKAERGTAVMAVGVLSIPGRVEGDFFKNEDTPIHIIAGALSLRQGQVVFENGVTLNSARRGTLTAPRMEITLSTNEVVLSEGIFWNHPNYQLHAQQLKLQDHQFRILSRFHYQTKRFTLDADTAVVQESPRNLTANGHVLIQRPNDLLKSDSAQLSEQQLTIPTGVRIETGALAKYLSNPRDPRYQSPRLKATIQKPAVILADRLDQDLRQSVTMLTGHLQVLQESKSAHADRGRYDAESRQIELAGDVRLRDQGESVRGDAAHVDLIQGIFKVSGNIEAKILMRQ